MTGSKFIIKNPELPFIYESINDIVTTCLMLEHISNIFGYTTTKKSILSFTISDKQPFFITRIKDDSSIPSIRKLNDSTYKIPVLFDESYTVSFDKDIIAVPKIMFNSTISLRTEILLLRPDWYWINDIDKSIDCLAPEIVPSVSDLLDTLS